MPRLGPWAVVLVLALAASPALAEAPSGDGAALAPFEAVQVSSGVYRSRKPREEDLKHAAALGIRTVLSLQRWMAHGEAEAAEGLGLRVLSVPMDGLVYPEFWKVDQAVALLADPALRPILVHCEHGRDRTGIVVAAYRISQEHASVDAAMTEARAHGCCHWLGDLRSWLERYQAHLDRGGPGGGGLDEAERLQLWLKIAGEARPRDGRSFDGAR